MRVGLASIIRILVIHCRKSPAIGCANPTLSRRADPKLQSSPPERN